MIKKFGHVIYIPAALFLLALLIRVLFILETRDIASLSYLVPGLDMDLRWQAAILLNSNLPIDESTFELMLPSSPLFPYLLAFTQTLIGASVENHRYLMAFIGALNTVLIYILLGKFISARVFVVVGSIIWTLMPAIIFFDTVLHKSSLLLTILLLSSLLVVNKQHSLKGLLVVGGALVFLGGVGYLLQQKTILFFLGFLGLWFWVNGFSLHKLAIYIFSFLLFILIFLGAETRAFFPSAEDSWFRAAKGSHMYLGFHEGSDGSYSNIRNIAPWPYGHLFHARMVAESEVGRRLSQTEVDQYYLEKSISYVLNEPAKMALLTLKKMALLFNNVELKGAEYLAFYETKSKILSYNPLGMGLLVMLSGMGILAFLREKNKKLLFFCIALIFAVALPHVATFVSWRYRLPLYLPMLLLAAKGAEYLWSNRAYFFDGLKPRTGNNFKVITLFIVFTFIAYMPLLSSKTERSYMNGAIYNENLAYKGASKRERLTHLDDRAGKQEQIQRATLLFQLHLHTAAFQEIKDLFRQGVRNKTVISLYVKYLFWLGDYEQAKELLSWCKKNNSHVYREVIRAFKPAEMKVYTRLIRSDIVGR